MEITLSNLALKHLVEELQFLQNGFVNNVQSMENGWTKVKVHTKEFGDKQLVLTPSALFVSSYSLMARQNPGGFSALMKKYLNKQRIISLVQHSADRVVVFEFPEIFLVIELFAKGNILICDKEMKIIKAMRKEEWKDRILAQGEKYKYPSSRGANPLDETKEEFEKKLKVSPKSFFGASVDALNTSPLILEKAFDDLKLDKKKNANEATKKEAGVLLEKMKEVFSSKAQKPFLSQGVIYTTALGEGKEREREFDNISAALNALLLSEDAKKEVIINEAPAKAELKKLQKQEKDAASKLTQIKGLEVAEKEAQEKGELIFLKYSQIKEVLSAIEKARAKGISEKEITTKINAIKPLIKELDFKKNRLVLDLQ